MAALQQQQQRQQIVTWRLQGRILGLDEGPTQIQSKPRSEWTPFFQSSAAAAVCSK
jgi:hypothetical protein